MELEYKFVQEAGGAGEVVLKNGIIFFNQSI